MDILSDNLYSAIFQRCSRRKLIPSFLQEADVYHLLHAIERINTLFEGSRVELVRENPDRVFKGLLGPLGKIKGACAYAAFIGDSGHPRVYEQVGYLGECFILEATRHGLGTCWVGGLFRPSVVAEHIDLKKNEAVLAVSPVGYVLPELSAEEKMLARLTRSSTRKSLKEITGGLPPEQWPTWVNSALEAAVRAPSAMNRQPWRFRVEQEAITLSADRAKEQARLPRRLDCGIAMLHLELGALHHGVRGTWQYLQYPEIARFTASYT